MKLVLAGASGFTGGEVLKQALDDAAIERVVVLTRRPLGITHAKLDEVVLESFLDYQHAALRDCDACVWCLGVSQTKVSEADYIRITNDYAVAAARALVAVNPALRFCFVSGRGADPREQSKRLFTRIKGRAERHLAEISSNTFVFRPGYIRPSSRSGPRKDAARFFAPLGTLIGLFVDDFGVDCDQLARCLLDVAKHGATQRLFDNATISEWKTQASAKPTSAM